MQTFPVKEDDLKLDTWRPYFYDSFNRVGNCTILSLCENVDALIKVIKGGSLTLNNDTYSKTAYLNSSSFEFKPYTSLRIYWKLMKDPFVENGKIMAKSNICHDKSKAFYLCKGGNVMVYNTNSSIKLMDSSYTEVLKVNTSEAITRRLFGNSKLNAISSGLEIKSEDVEMVPEPLVLKSDTFWESVVSFIKSMKPKFTFTNIDFKFKTFTGEEKFPIQFWNTAKPDTKDKLLSSVESHWLLAKIYDHAERNTISSDMFLENVIKINHGKEKISSLFISHKVKKPRTKTHNLQGIQNYNEIEIVPDQRSLPISMRYRRYKENPKKVLVGPSKIHCQGLFALEHFSQGDIVIEYVGEVIDNVEADLREKKYEKSGMSDCYLFRLDKNRIIDASYKGNMARFLNHSCDANCNAKIESISGEKHILILANRFISKGEELTYFYNFAVESDKIECLCGAPNCLKRLN